MPCCCSCREISRFWIDNCRVTRSLVFSTTMFTAFSDNFKPVSKCNTYAANSISLCCIIIFWPWQKTMFINFHIIIIYVILVWKIIIIFCNDPVKFRHMHFIASPSFSVKSTVFIITVDSEPRVILVYLAFQSPRYCWGLLGSRSGLGCWRPWNGGRLDCCFGWPWFFFSSLPCIPLGVFLMSFCGGWGWAVRVWVSL